MDSLIPQLLAFPPHSPPPIPLNDAEYDKQIKAHVHLLGTVQSKLTSTVPGGGDLLNVSIGPFKALVSLTNPFPQIIDPSINSLPYLFALLAHIFSSGGKQKAGTVSNAFRPGYLLWQKALDFMERFDPIQVRYAGNEFRRLVDVIAVVGRRKSEVSATLYKDGLGIINLL